MTDSQASGPHNTNRSDPLYVGYMPAPDEHRRAVKRTLILLAAWLSFCAFTLVLTMPSPGEGVWENTNERVWEGFLTNDPYPMLLTPEETLLVVSMGKHGAHDQIDEFANSHVSLRGYELRRQGRRMIELVPDSITSLGEAPSSQPTLSMLDIEPIDFTGEIIDGKCYLGAMKPGNGFAHRACAVLCLRGGLPAMFAEDDASPDEPLPLLIVDGSTQVPEHVMQHIATRVQMKARRASIGTLPVLIVDSSTIERANDFFGNPKAIVIEQSED